MERLNSPAWAFRGQRLSRWGLITSLERALPKGRSVKEAETHLLGLFRRRAHHYLPDGQLPLQPKDFFHETRSGPLFGENRLEWLALMQHHGAPTQILDLTRSRFVACYFALEDADPTADTENPYAAIWAFDIQWLKRTGIERLQTPRTVTSGDRPYVVNKKPPHIPQDDNLADPRYVAEVFRGQVPGVFPVEPYRMNERLTAQQGLFLYPSAANGTFMENLLSYPIDSVRQHVYKVEVPAVCRVEALRDLNTMNVNRATLFPGIDGFSQSLRYTLAQE